MKTKKNILVLAIAALVLICSMNTVVLANEVSNKEDFILDLRGMTEDGTYQFGDFVVTVSTQMTTSQALMENQLLSEMFAPIVPRAVVIGVLKRLDVKVVDGNFNYVPVGTAYLQYGFTPLGDLAIVEYYSGPTDTSAIWCTSITLRDQRTYSPSLEARYSYVNPLNGGIGFAVMDSYCYADGSWR